MKERVLTGLQPTGVITLGNLIGSIKQMVEYQDKYDSYLLIVDLHAITVPQDSIKLHDNIKSLAALYLACGIDPKKTTIFIQSENEHHANISWLLECNTQYGELSRMVQFKEKSKKNSNFTSGLLTYPVLMAADILAYDANYVPVGIDQKQHVELARNIAEKFNNKYGETFVVPDVLLSTTGTKIMDLLDPTKKMSKSAENQKGIINLLDDVEVSRKKIMGATTDSDNKIIFDPENKPGISNLINILASLSSKSIKEVEKECQNLNYGEFKKQVAECVTNVISEIQTKYYDIINSGQLTKILNEGREKSREVAGAKLELMKDRMGILRDY